MKTGKIINKNIKLLLRSRISTLVLILGPLLVILLVGISFSTSSFHLNIGVFSEKYSEMSESFIDTLEQENYGVTKYQTENLCVQSVKTGQSHACVVFPPDLSIDNDKTNIIKFHVDQSKINLVYLVMSTLTSSFGERTTQISEDLTDQLVTTLFDVKTDLESSESLIEEIKNNNDAILQDSESSSESLDDLDLSSSGNVNLGLTISEVNDEMDNLVEETTDLIEDGFDLAEDIEDHGSLNNNQSKDLENLVETLNDIKAEINESHNATLGELNKAIEDIYDSFDDMSEKLETAENVNSEVITKLNNIKTKSTRLKEDAESLNNKIKNMVSNINAIQITNTESIVSPIKTEINPIVENENNLGFLFPSLVVILIMFIGLLLPATLIIMEKNSRAYFRTFTTPTKERLFVLANFLTSMLLIFVQLVVILLVSRFYFNLNLSQSFFIMTLSLFMIISFFILLGMLIGYILNTEEMAMLAAVSLGTLFLLTSGIIFPLESMPEYLIDKAKFNPVVLGSEMFKQSLLFGTDFATVKLALGYMLMLSTIMVGLIFIIKKSERIQFALKKPGRVKIKQDWLRNQFDFGERKAKTLPEFIISIQNLNEDRFRALHQRNAIHDWLSLVFNNNYLAKKIENLMTQDDVLKVLVEELKKHSKDKK